MPSAASVALFAFFLFCSLFCVAASPAAAGGLIGSRAAHLSVPQPSVAESTAVRLDESREGVTLTFDLTAPVTPSVFVLADPDRAILDLPQVDFKIDEAVGHPAGRRPPGGIVQSFRFGLLSPGRSRIVVDLAAPARVKADPARKVGDHYELAIRLERTDRASFRSAARSSTLSAVAAIDPQSGAAPPTDKPTVVIDPGHGGPDTGAVVNGIVEKDVALAFAKLLAQKLEAKGIFNVVMTRSEDVFIPLSERVQIARRANAALMVSIHCDKLPDDKGVSGATVYTVSDRASDAYAAKVAADENASDAAAGVVGLKDAADVNDILFDLTREETRAYSHVFARTLVNYWKVAGRLNKNPQRAAGFMVLKAPDVPSVLLELGYLSSPTDSASLTSDAWREQATGRMVEAIQSYFAQRRGTLAPKESPVALRQ